MASDSTGIEFADILTFEGDCTTAVYADSSYATADSIGLNFALILPQGQYGGSCLIKSNVHRLNGTEEDNLLSESTIALKSNVEQDIYIVLMHRDASDHIVEVQFPSISASDSATVTVETSSELTNYRAGLDVNSDGQIDYWYYADGTVTGTPQVPNAAVVTLHDAYPNPFNPQTTIALELGVREAVSLRVFDVSGRLVRVLVDGEIYDPGHHETVWNGRDDAGRQLASGTYFYRLESAGYSETKRMVLVK